MRPLKIFSVSLHLNVFIMGIYYRLALVMSIGSNIHTFPPSWVPSGSMSTDNTSLPI